MKVNLNKAVSCTRFLCLSPSFSLPPGLGWLPLSRWWINVLYMIGQHVFRSRLFVTWDKSREGQCRWQCLFSPLMSYTVQLWPETSLSCSARYCPWPASIEDRLVSIYSSTPLWGLSFPPETFKSHTGLFLGRIIIFIRFVTFLVHLINELKWAEKAISTGCESQLLTSGMLLIIWDLPSHLEHGRRDNIYLSVLYFLFLWDNSFKSTQNSTWQ